jgi:hypothetical protein
MNATPNSFQNFNSLSLNYLKFVTPKIWVLQRWSWWIHPEDIRTGQVID